MHIFIKYLERRKTASNIHKCSWTIREALSYLATVKSDKEYYRICNVIRWTIEGFEEEWELLSNEEKDLIEEFKIFEFNNDVWSWLVNFDKLLRKMKKDQMPMLCILGMCISIWEIPILLISYLAVYLYFII